MIAVISLVTVLLRFLPFWIFGKKRTVPPFVAYLGRVLPPAAMGM
ncbi:MAG: AzlD domain-containing protein, partial [Clostridia bacterium]|nr:AzlD domain-containing protein [Clostridia bacterium]